jgi:hypothetical protein
MKILTIQLPVLGLLTVSSHAALISGPSQITATTAMVGQAPYPNINQIADGIDLNTDGPNPYNGFRTVSIGSITLKFDQPYDIHKFLLANDIRVPSSAGITNFDLTFYDVLNNNLGNSGGFSAIQNQVANQVFNFAPVTGVKTVILNITSVRNDITQIREVAFESVPETSSALLGACGVFTLITRRRRRSR